MNIKKLWGKILRLPENIQMAFGVIAVLFAIIAISIILVKTMMFFDKSLCLDSQYPRRWDNGICEEYRDDKWGKPSESGIYYYNEAGSRTTE